MEHDVIPLGERHAHHNWEYADATERLAAVGFVSTDINKVALQLDTGTYWRLTAYSPPTWWPVVSVTKSDVGLGNVDNTSDVNKPVSTAQALADTAVYNAATAASTPVAHATDTNNPHGVTKTQVGLGNVDNTSDVNKPVSTAQATALSGKTNMTGFPVDSFGNYLCTLTYNETTRTVTLTPTGSTFDVYVSGVKHTFTGAQSIVHSATGAAQFVYFDTTGTLVTGTSPWSILLHVPVCYIFQDVTNSRRIPLDERHHAGRDLYWHHNQHFAEGTKAVSGFAASGYTLNNGASDGVLQVAIASGRVDDEDISVTTQELAAAGPYNLLYRSGASGDWRITRASTLPCFYTGNTLQYNQNTGATWQLTNMTEDYFVNYWVFALTALPTTDITPTPSSTQQFVIIAGQAIYSSQASADAETVSSLAYGSAPFQEMAPLYKMTFRFNASNPSAYTNTARTALTAISRVVGSFASLTATAQSDHGALTGLTDPDHPASAIIFTPTGGIAATDVQTAIAELDTEKVAQTGSDSTMTRQMFKDTGFVYYDSTTTNALDYVNGSCQRWAPNTGSQTLTISNWPPTGNLGELLIQGVNLGAATITWPTINWVKSDGTTTTTFSSNGVTLQASGTDWVYLWTRDAGTTIYGKVVR